MDKRWMLPFLLSLGAVRLAYATPILLASTRTSLDPTQHNNATHDNVLINPYPNIWHPNGTGLWVSYADTGKPGTLPDPQPATAESYKDFTLPYGRNSATLRVWADDTARVWIGWQPAD